MRKSIISMLMEVQFVVNKCTKIFNKICMQNNNNNNNNRPNNSKYCNLDFYMVFEKEQTM
jgi:hypothetical protein